MRMPTQVILDYFIRSSPIKTIICLTVIGIILFSAATLAMTATAQNRNSKYVTDIKSDDYQARENDAYSIGVQAYIYGLAPVMMERIEKVFVTTPGVGHAPVNQFGHATHLATPNDTDVVAPNSDTLYSVAWLELGNGPVILHVPDTYGRYYVMQLMDAYTNTFNSVGRRTTGTGEGNYAIVGPGWNGSLPQGVKEIRSPTNTVWIIGRTLVNGEPDTPNVQALQEQYTLTLLDHYGKPSMNAKNQTLADFNKMAPSPDAQKNLRFFEELRVALKNNQPPQDEAGLMAVFDRIGLGKNETPYGPDMDPAVAAGLSRALKDGDQIVKNKWKQQSGININGWVLQTNIGTYGNNYLLRAAIAEGSIGANLPQEAAYPKAQVDSDGQPLNGANKYVMHFEKGMTPPAGAFWSLTMYNKTTHMLVYNAINRYTIGDRTPGLVYSPDGSLDIYIQHDRPTGNESNWLPTPEGDFFITLRIYQPKPEVLEGTYRIPPLQKVG